MINVKFSYNNKEFTIQCTDDSPISQVLHNSANNIGKNINNLNYFMNLKNIKSECTIGEMKSHMINEEINIQIKDCQFFEQTIKSEQIICPRCLVFPKFKFKNYKISLTECACLNKGEYDHILLDEFGETQKLYESNNHNDNKIQIQNQMKCQEHEDELFCSYCLDCKKDLCPICRSEHKSDYNNHKIIELGNLIPDRKKLIANYNNLEETIDKTNKTIEEYIQKLKKVNESLKALKIMAHDIVYNYDPKKRTFVILNNINNFKYDFVLNDLNNINNDKDIKSKFQKIIELYDNIVYDEINITYDLNKEIIENNKIKIFGEKFVENNKNNCIIIYNNKQYDLSEFLEDINHINNNKHDNNVNESQNEENVLSIKLKMDINKITNLSNMFNECIQLKFFSDISEIKTFNVTDISNIFYGCDQLKSLPDISKWNTSNVQNMAGLFQGCSSLQSLPNISKWKTSKVENMNDLFNGCVNLKEIRISDWDISSVESMNSMFKDCLNLHLLELPRNWNISNVRDKTDIFKGCNRLDKSLI